MTKHKKENNSADSDRQPNISQTGAIDDHYVDKQLVIEDRYGIDPDTNYIDGAQVRHPNRNGDKRTDRRKATSAKSSSNSGTKSPASKEGADVTPEEISLVSKELLGDLFNFKGEVCVSVYVPLQPQGPITNAPTNHIHVKTAIQQAQRSAEQGGKALVDRTFAPVHNWLNDDTFFNNITAAGIAIFLSEGYFKYALLPEPPPNKTLVNNSFLVAPLLSAFVKAQYFYLLVISKKQSKLFRGDQHGLTYLPISEMPNGIEDVVHLEEKDDENLFRSGSSGAGGGAVYHGTGSSRPDDKENIAMYLAEVDSTIRKHILHDATAPLVLAGVGYLIPIFRKVTHYNHVWEKAITGNYEYETDAVLFKAASEVMGDYFESAKKKALEDYGRKSATDLTSHILDDIIRAAYYKRIDTLFVDKRARLWGSFDDVNDKLEVSASENGEHDDLIDKTILKTLLSGGSVFMLEETEMPARRMMLAILRY